MTPELSFGELPYVLVTPGGGGDGEELIDWVLRAYESDPDMPVAARSARMLDPFADTATRTP